MPTRLIIIGSISLLLLIAIVFILLNKHLLKNEKLLLNESNEFEKLSFDEINNVIDKVCGEVYTNKYLLYYRLRDITIIPDMEKDVNDITKEIIHAFSTRFLNQIYRFYSRDYFYAMITRRVQLILVEYTNQHKPNTK